MRALFRSIEKVAPSDATVLITGESGTGKELVAQAIHRRARGPPGPSSPSTAPLCPKLSRSPSSSGTRRGRSRERSRRAPENSSSRRTARMFLDEVATLSSAVQAKLLRVLETRQFERVGSSRTISANIRMLAATNEDLSRRAREGTFREDLLYRLNTVTLSIPALRDRGGDILVLLDSFAERFGRHYRKKPKTFSPEVRETLDRYRWPGNVREMEHLVEMLTLMVEDDEIRPEHLPGSVGTAPADSSAVSCRAGGRTLAGDAAAGGRRPFRAKSRVAGARPRGGRQDPRRESSRHRPGPAEVSLPEISALRRRKSRRIRENPRVKN